MMLVTSSPVASSSSSASSAPRPGTCTPSSTSGRSGRGTQLRRVHEVQDEPNHQHRGDDRQPHQQPRDQIASQDQLEDRAGQRRPRCLTRDLAGAACGRAWLGAVGARLRPRAAATWSRLRRRLAAACRLAAWPRWPLACAPAAARRLASAGAAALGRRRRRQFRPLGVLGSLGLLGIAPTALSFSAPARLRLRSWSDLKSVSYQPEPLSRNTGAEISFCSVLLPQEGHFFSLALADLLHDLEVDSDNGCIRIRRSAWSLAAATCRDRRNYRRRWRSYSCQKAAAAGGRLRCQSLGGRAVGAIGDELGAAEARALEHGRPWRAHRPPCQ